MTFIVVTGVVNLGDGDCLVSRELTLIEPGLNENKYYKPGMGLILEVEMEGNRA